MKLATNFHHPLSCFAAFSAAMVLMLSGLPMAAQANDAPVVQLNSESTPSNAPPGVLVSDEINGDQSAIFSDPGDTLNVSSCSHDQENTVDSFNCGSSGRVWIQMKTASELTALDPVPSDPIITTVSITVSDSGGNTASTSYKYTTGWGAE